MEEATGTRVVNFCELCGDEAYLHCDADSAFLCRCCDAKFHASNFLFARHIRRIICPDCKSVTPDFISGPLSPWPSRIRCCSRSCSSSNSDLSSTMGEETTRKKHAGIRARRREERAKDIAKGIFVNWCDKLGIKGDSRNAVVSLAFLALAVERPRARKKVILAASFWFGIKNSRKKMTWRSLSKVEDVTGVTAGTIRADESKLARALKLQIRQWRVDLEEGWAENDDV